MSHTVIRVAAALLAASGIAPAAAPAAPPPAGVPVQLPAPNACLANAAIAGCAADPFSSFQGPAASGYTTTLEVAPQGADLYIANATRIGRFRRDPATGALVPQGWIHVAGPGSLAGLAIAADGTRVLAADGKGGLGRVSAFTRDPATGVLTAPGCADENGAGGCANVQGIAGATQVALPPSGPGVYVAAERGAGDGTGDGFGEGALVTLSRDPSSGVFSQRQCFPAVDDGIALSPCHKTGEGVLKYLASVAVSPEGTHVYAAGYGGVVGYNRNPANGDLVSRVACLRHGSGTTQCPAEPRLPYADDLALSPDGQFLYIGGRQGLAVIHREPTSGALTFLHCFRANGLGSSLCPELHGFKGARGVATSADGGIIYTTGGGHGLGEGEVRAFRRDPTTGELIPIGCVAYAGTGGCTPGTGLLTAMAVGTSDDGRSLYVASKEGTGAGDLGALAAFGIEAAPSCQDAAASVAAGGTVSLPLTCTDPNGDPVTRTVTSGPSGGSLGAIDQTAGSVNYTAAPGAGGNQTVTFTGSDGANASAPASVAITVTPGASGPPSEALPITPGATVPAADSAAPRSRIRPIPRSVRAAKLTRFRGTAGDDRGVARVEITLLRLRGGAKPGARAAAAKPACKHLLGNGRLGRSTIRRRTCAVAGFQRTKGTTAWTFRLKRRLPSGSYVLYSRATDTSGNRETRFSARRGNRTSFRVNRPSQSNRTAQTPVPDTST